jgi:hypothetical protein
MRRDGNDREVDQGEWLSLTQAAAQLGWTRERLRSLIRRDRDRHDHDRRIEIMQDNRGELRIRLSTWLIDVANRGRPTMPTTSADHGQPTRPAPVDHPDAELLAELWARLAKLEADHERQARELLQAVERAAGAEGENRTLRDALADLSRRLDRAEERLAQPWWRRLLGG